MRKNVAVTLTFAVENIVVAMVTNVAMVVRDAVNLGQVAAASPCVVQKTPYVVPIKNIAAQLDTHAVMKAMVAAQKNQFAAENIVVLKIRSAVRMEPVVIRTVTSAVEMDLLAQKGQYVAAVSVAERHTNVVELNVVH